MSQSNIEVSIWLSKLAAIVYASILIPPSAGLIDFLVVVALSKSSLKPAGLATLKERDRSTVLLLLCALLALLDEELSLCP